MRFVRLALALVLSTLLLPAASWAQSAPPSSHVADRATVDQMLSSQSDQNRADRDTIHHLLQRPDVRELAGHYGLSIERADSAVNTLSGDELHQIAAQAQQANDALAGGASTVVLSTTTIIIILLLVILLIVAVK